MNPDNKNAVRTALAAKGLNQTQLAEVLGKERAAVSRTLSKSPIDERSLWPAILDALGLEIVIQPKKLSTD